MYKNSRSSLIAGILFVSVNNPVIASLTGVLPSTPGGTDYQAYYDDQLNITWTANANLYTGDWYTADATVTSLTINGVSGWRLPNMDVNGDSVIVDCTSSAQGDCRDNEYGHLFYYGSGTTFDSGVSSLDPAPFSNVQAAEYWSIDPTTTAIFSFCKLSGGRGCMSSGGSYGLTGPYSAWAVHDGNVGTVPAPAAVWLFGSALVGLVGIGRRRLAN